MYPTKKLGNLGKVIRGVTYSKGDLLDSYEEFCLTLLRANNINDGINFDELQYLPKGFVEGDKILKEGDIIFCMSSGSRSLVGKNTIVPELQNHSFGAFCSSFRLNSDDNINYIGYFLKSETYKKYIYSLSQGVNILNLRGSDLETLEIPLPPLSTQSRIVARLDAAFASIDEQISLLRANIADVENMRKSVFEECFRSNGYEVRKLEDVCEISSKLIDPRENQYLDLLHVGGANIESNSGNLIDLKTAKEENLISGKFIFDDSMVLYSKIRPYLMKVARPDFTGLCSADIYPLSPKNGLIYRDFLHYLLLSSSFTEYAIKGSSRAGMPKVNRECLFAYTFPLPPLPHQHEIVAHLDEVFETTQALRSEYEVQIGDLETLKQSLLEEAFAGSLVGDEA